MLTLHYRKLFNNEDGRDVARDDAEDSALSSTREGGSDLARLRAQMASRNAAAKTGTADSDRPAPTVAHPPSTQVHPPPRTPPPSSPAHISSTPRPVPRPRPIPRPVKTPVRSSATQDGSPAPPLRTPLASTTMRNIPPSSQPASPPAKTVSRAPAKTVLDSQADGGTPGSDLTESDEEPQRKQKVPAKRKGKSKAVESSDDEPELPSRSKRKAVAPSRKPAARSTKKQKK